MAKEAPGRLTPEIQWGRKGSRYWVMILGAKANEQRAVKIQGVIL